MKKTSKKNFIIFGLSVCLALFCIFSAGCSLPSCNKSNGNANNEYIQALLTEIDNLNLQIKTKEKEIAELKADMAAIEFNKQKLEEMTVRVTTLTNEITQARAEIEILKSKNLQLEDILKSHEMFNTDKETGYNVILSQTISEFIISEKEFLNDIYVSNSENGEFISISANYELTLHIETKLYFKIYGTLPVSYDGGNNYVIYGSNIYVNEEYKAACYISPQYAGSGYIDLTGNTEKTLNIQFKDFLGNYTKQQIEDLQIPRT